MGGNAVILVFFAYVCAVVRHTSRPPESWPEKKYFFRPEVVKNGVLMHLRTFPDHQNIDLKKLIF